MVAAEGQITHLGEKSMPRLDNAQKLPRHTLLSLLMLPLFASLFTLGSLGFTATPAEASSYSEGYAKGKKVGRQHGYEDGFKGAYKASYVDELIFGGNSKYRTANFNSAEYQRGYKDGYRVGYEIGYRAGSRDGGEAGREDAKNWKAELREKMRECMRRGGFGC